MEYVTNESTMWVLRDIWKGTGVAACGKVDVWVEANGVLGETVMKGGWMGLWEWNSREV